MRRLTEVLSGHTFYKVNLLGNKIAVFREGCMECAGWSESSPFARAIRVISLGSGPRSV